MRSKPGTESLRGAILLFIRRFGLLETAQTPCGHPLSVSEAHALMILLAQNSAVERVTQKALGEALCIDKSNVSRLCRRLVAAGHVRSVPSAVDRRVRHVSLTDRGRTLARALDVSSRARFDALARALPSRSVAPVVDALSLLNAALLRPLVAEVGSSRRVTDARARVGATDQ
jgi:DNA-binding MarR family transcriptional regulator